MTTLLLGAFPLFPPYQTLLHTTPSSFSLSLGPPDIQIVMTSLEETCAQTSVTLAEIKQERALNVRRCSGL